MTSRIRNIIRKGPIGISKAVLTRLTMALDLIRTRKGIEYRSPDDRELFEIEAALEYLGISCRDYFVDTERYARFKERFSFDTTYHGGEHGGVFEEKLLEHFVAWDLLNLECNPEHWPYIDIAGASSPWAKILRENQFDSYSIDLFVPPQFSELDYYMQGDATSIPFPNSSFGSASLQCAYEMFAGDSDIRLIAELARILRPGGRVVISPLYTHTHACYYQSPDWYERCDGDQSATRYIRRDTWGIPSSRKYSAETLVKRVIEPAHATGLIPSVHVLRNKASVAPGIYLHFLLMLDKPLSQS